jgi:hypothetical protein
VLDLLSAKINDKSLAAFPLLVMETLFHLQVSSSLGSVSSSHQPSHSSKIFTMMVNVAQKTENFQVTPLVTDPQVFSLKAPLSQKAMTKDTFLSFMFASKPANTLVLAFFFLIYFLGSKQSNVLTLID